MFTQDLIGLWTCWFCRGILQRLHIPYIYFNVVLLLCKFNCVFIGDHLSLTLRLWVMKQLQMQREKLSCLTTRTKHLDNRVSHQNWSSTGRFQRCTMLSSNYIAYSGNIDWQIARFMWQHVARVPISVSYKTRLIRSLLCVVELFFPTRDTCTLIDSKKWLING